MKRYYLIVQNWTDLIPLGQFPSLIDADKYVSKYEDNLAHGERWVIVTKDDLQRNYTRTFEMKD